MFSAFKKMFRKSGGELPGAEIVIRPKGEPVPDDADPLADVAIRPEATPEFIQLLDKHGIHVVGKNARKVEGKPFFDFLSSGEEFYVFSSQRQAIEFIRTIPIKEATPYSLVGLNSDFLLKNDFSSIRLVLNPRSRFERVITREDLEALHQVQAA
jgi:hypothetical protein